MIDQEGKPGSGPGEGPVLHVGVACGVAGGEQRTPPELVWMFVTLAGPSFAPPISRLVRRSSGAPESVRPSSCSIRVPTTSSGVTP